MRKKLFAVVIAIALVFAMIPSISFATTNKSVKEKPQSKEYSTIVQIVKENGYLSKVEIKAIQGEMESLRESVKNIVDQTFAMYVEEESKYSSIVWDEINAAYKKSLSTINNAKNSDELIEYSFEEGGYIPNSSIMEQLEIVGVIGEYNKTMISTAADVESMRKTVAENINNILSKYKQTNYNTYNWSIVTGLKKKCQNMINSAKTCTDIAKAQIYQYTYFEETDDFDDYFDEDYYEEGKFFDIYYVEFVIGDYFYSNKELTTLRTAGTNLLRHYVDRQLKWSAYKGDMKSVNSIVNDAITNMNKAIDGEDIVNIAFDVLDYLVAETGIDMENLSNSEKIRLKKQVNDIFYNYKEKDYSLSKWETMQNIYDYTINAIEMVNYKIELPKDVIGDVKKSFSSVPNYAAELKTSKAKYVAKLNKYKKNAKYDQKKVVPIVKSGVKAINGATTLSKVSSTYTSYKAKADKTIKTYKIKTSKKGKGFITASKSVKYGSSYTLKITPAAGYKISKVYRNGKLIKKKNSYKLSNIKKSYTYKVVFTK